MTSIRTQAERRREKQLPTGSMRSAPSGKDRLSSSEPWQTWNESWTHTLKLSGTKGCRRRSNHDSSTWLRVAVRRVASSPPYLKFRAATGESPSPPSSHGSPRCRSRALTVSSVYPKQASPEKFWAKCGRWRMAAIGR
jgi:hypothetical protein